jgi:hypothetical protein
MSMVRIMQIIFILAIAGVLFSGYLSYYELFVPAGCSEAIVSCGDKPVVIANLPACVYGFFMYTAILLLSGFSLLRNRKVK